MDKIYFRDNRGFTLIELLTVIAIISLLSTVILTSLSTSRQKAVDASVKMQIKSIANALYLARDATTGAWPGSIEGGYQCLKSSGTCFKELNYNSNPNLIAQLVPAYISSMPTPPNPPFGSDTYLYGSYGYVPYYNANTWGPPGAYLIWGQTMPIASSACDGYTPVGALPDGIYYCYQYLGR